jgi:hypothetical protein
VRSAASQYVAEKRSSESGLSFVLEGQSSDEVLIKGGGGGGDYVRSVQSDG